MKRTINPVAEPKSGEPKVQGELNFDTTVIYPSGTRKTKIKLAFLKWDYDLSINQDPKPVHNLEGTVDGRTKAVCGHPLYEKIAAYDSEWAKAGEVMVNYDKIKSECALCEMQEDSKKNGGKKFRRGIELYIPCFIFSIDSIDPETKEKTTLDVNREALVGFNVGDLYFKGGFGKSLIEFYENEQFENGKFAYTADTLTMFSIMNPQEAEVVAALRTDDIQDAFSHLMPLTYEEYLDSPKKEFKQSSGQNSAPKSDNKVVSMAASVKSSATAEQALKIAQQNDSIVDDIPVKTAGARKKAF